MRVQFRRTFAFEIQDKPQMWRLAALCLILGSCCVANPSCFIPSLCTQQTGYYLAERNQTLAIAPGPICHQAGRGPNAPNSCVLCGQISSIKHIDCRKTSYDGENARTLLLYAGEHTGLQSISMHTLEPERDDDHVLPEISTTPYYITPTNNIDFMGFINVTKPVFGAVAASDLYIEMDYLPLDHNALGRGFQVELNVLGIMQGVYSSKMNYLSSSNIEPASWFFTVTPVVEAQSTSGAVEQEKRGFPTQGYIEFVLDEEDIIKNRRFVDNDQSGQSAYNINTVIRTHRAQVNQHSPHTPLSTHYSQSITDITGDTASTIDDKVNICIWSSNVMDGQKRIWLQQIEHLDPEKFRFTWMITLPEGRRLEEDPSLFNGNSLCATATRLFEQNDNGRVIDSPFNSIAIDVATLREDPGDGRRPMSELWTGKELDLYSYAHESLVRANYSIDHVRPQWCRQFYLLLRDTLPRERCSALVYGNERGFSPDVLVTNGARILGIPTVAELLNLFVHEDVVPTVLVAPSTFAAEHESVQSVLKLYSHHGVERNPLSARLPMTTVIAPSADTKAFNPARFAENRAFNPAVYQHPSCRAVGYVYKPGDAPSAPCVVIAFIARLAPEKSIGLFIQAAYEILQLYPLARFTLVGDGAIRSSLEDLAARLQITHAVHFAGWVSATDLPALLAGVDIVINPSLRAWSETFCIANIEVMSMAVPLVTFAVGGIGEYVQDPALITDHSISFNDSSGDFSVSKNAVVVHRATPMAVARATNHLILHPELRQAIGIAARETVVAHFGVQRQMQEYADLYTYLHHLSK